MALLVRALLAAVFLPVGMAVAVMFLIMAVIAWIKEG
jgi:hypothetical protein